MRKSGKLILLLTALCALLTVGVFASGEPSGEVVPAGADGFEPIEAAAESETAAIDVTILVNGVEYSTAKVGASVDGNVYTFEVGEFFDALGLVLSYDEDTDVASVSARPDTLMSVLLAWADGEAGEPSGEPSGDPPGEASGEPPGEASGEPLGEASGEPPGEASGEPSGEASGEASGEPSGEPSEEPSGEPSEELSGETRFGLREEYGRIVRNSILMRKIGWRDS